MKDEIKIFKEGDLQLYDWQYQICHTNINMFKVGQTVFLKSNPESAMKIFSIDSKSITTKWKSNNGSDEICAFSPRCLLQYKYAALLLGKNKYKVCLN
jgi:hypothetical protein